MNSDPHESAAWRIFGLLDPDEAAAFDDAMRDDQELKHAYLEIECLTAAVAAATTISVTPRPGQLERLQLKLGLNPAKNTNWLGISGWAAAAALAMVLILQRGPEIRNTTARNARPSIITSLQVPNISPTEQIPALTQDTITDIPPHLPDTQAPEIAKRTAQQETKIIVKVETERLIQEIEVLREKFDALQQKDQQRFAPVPGMAWPIVMRMSSPKPGALTLEKDSADITTLLGDALSAVASGDTLPQLETRSSEPSAIQIYDPAIDAGTLVVSNLPNAADDEEFTLFVSQKKGGKPILVGRLPRTEMGRSKSFDYALGSTATIPATFTLVKGKRGKTAEPNELNTVLRGPK
jgi:hypothetical protein